MEADLRPTATIVNAVRAFVVGRLTVEGGSLRQGIWDAYTRKDIGAYHG